MRDRRVALVHRADILDACVDPEVQERDRRGEVDPMDHLFGLAMDIGALGVEPPRSGSTTK
jgi:hypothetical protein